MLKRFLCAVCCFLCALAALTGCAAQQNKPAEDTLSRFKAPDDIFTYVPLDAQKTQLVVGVSGNVSPEAANERFEELYPECEIVYKDYTRGENAQTLFKHFERGIDCDLIFINTGSIPNIYDTIAPYLVDLSANTVLSGYHQSALADFEVDGKIYFLPGPSDIMAITYNKTMFAQYGWEEPATYDAFIALCEQIRTDTAGTVVPFNPNAKYASYISQLFTLTSYGRILTGYDDWNWLEAFMDGNATFTGHMEPLFEDAQKMIDAELLPLEMFTYSASARGKEFEEGKIAMCNFLISAASKYAGFEVGYFPFPGQKPGEGYVMSESSYGLCRIKQEQVPEEKQRLIQAYLEFISTNEAQQSFIGDTAMISYLSGATQNTVITSSPLLHDAVQGGRMVEAVMFQNDGYDLIRAQIREQIMLMQEGKTDAAGACRAVDRFAAQYFAGENREIRNPVVGTAAKDFTILQTSQYFCDRFLETTGADIALMATNVNYRGNNTRIFAGEITRDLIVGLNPRNFGGSDRLCVVEMTGANLLEALNHPGDKGESDCVYASAGLKTTIKPWNEPGQRYLSVTLSDGSELSPDAVYRVALWSGSVPEAYITSTERIYDLTFVEHLTEWVESSAPLTPAEDGRCTLVW